MSLLLRSRRLTLAVLVAYFAAHTLGAVVHEQLHAHTGSETCCHDHAHRGDAATGRSAAPATGNGEANVPNTAILATAAHDHACVVCRIAGQPLVAAQAATHELTSEVSPDVLPAPASAPRSLAARLAHSRAPPTAC